MAHKTHQPAPDDLDLLTVQEVADLLKVPPATLYTWRYVNTGPAAIRVGKYLRYRRSEVRAWLKGLEDQQ